ncbi:MAG TPA: hypothetical protein VIX89_07395 [Bryobacteraceae bacterium]
MSDPTNLFWYSSVAVQFLLCAHLVWTKLARRHPIFTLYLACSVARSLVAVHYTVASNGALPLSYTYFWLWSEPLLQMLQIAVALEVHGGMWKEQAAIVRPARTLLFAALVTAIIFAAFPLKLELSHFSPIRLQAVMQFEFLAKRYISSVLCIFLVLSAVLYLVIIRNSLKSSLFRHESMLAAYFGIYAIASFAINMGWGATPLVNHYTLLAVTLCLVIWISVLKPAGSQAAVN